MLRCTGEYDAEGEDKGIVVRETTAAQQKTTEVQTDVFGDVEDFHNFVHPQVQHSDMLFSLHYKQPTEQLLLSKVFHKHGTSHKRLTHGKKKKPKQSLYCSVCLALVPNASDVLFRKGGVKTWKRSVVDRRSWKK